MRRRQEPAPSPRRTAVAVSLVLLVSSPLAGLAQAGPSVVMGATVRAKPTGPGAQWAQGELVAMTSDSVAIRLRQNNDTVTLARSTLAQFQVSYGRHAQTGKGALLGLSIGAGAGLLLGLAADAAYDCTGFCEIDFALDDVVALTALGGVIGGGVGALIGAAIRGERWQPASQPRPAMRHGQGVQRGTVDVQIRF